MPRPNEHFHEDPTSIRIPTIGLITSAPPEDYPRYQPLLGTKAVVPCVGIAGKWVRPDLEPCDRTAVRIWFDGIYPAVPWCDACYLQGGDGVDSSCRHAGPTRRHRHLAANGSERRHPSRALPLRLVGRVRASEGTPYQPGVAHMVVPLYVNDGWYVLPTVPLKLA